MKMYISRREFMWSMSLILVGVSLFVYIYRETISWLFERYLAEDTYYSHGFLVPFVSGWLIWLKRQELYAIKITSSRWGLALIVISLVIHLFSTLLGVYFVSGFSIMILILGLCLFLFGRNITDRVLFALLFLIFMFPLPLVAINSISFPMKMFVTKSVVFILKNIFNLPLYSQGFEIIFPHDSLIVENPCSGLRSLIVIVALTSIFCFFLKASRIRKILFFCLAFPIAFITNLVRVLLLALGAYIYGSNAIKGFFHDFSGYFVFILAFFILTILSKRLQCVKLK
jgi:exosortase